MNGVISLALPMLLLARMCGAAGEPGSPEDDDAGPTLDLDAGPTGSDGGAGTAPDTGLPPMSAGEFATGDRACFDGVDNDSLGGSDCEDESCVSEVNACCVGSGTCCGPDGAFPGVTLAFEGCTGTVATCFGAAGFREFG